MDERERDAYLDQVLVGGREKRRIVIVDYDATWPARFELERDRMQRALGTLAIRIEHIGSTSVPGLAGKPIVDVLVTVADPDNEQRWCRQCSLPVTSYGFESRDIGCSEPPNVTSMSTSGETPTRRLGATCASATGFASHQMINAFMSGSNEDSRGGVGAT